MVLGKSSSVGSSTSVHVYFSRKTLMVIGLAFAAPWLVVLWMYGHSSVLPSQVAEASQTNTQTNPPTNINSSMTNSPPKALASTHPTTPSIEQITESRPGAWGSLEFVPLTIELPDEYVFVPPATQPNIKWVFPGKNQEQTIDFLTQAGLSIEQVAQIKSANWHTAGDNVVLEPTDDLIKSLKPNARAVIYSYLMHTPENARTIDPFWFRPGKVDYRLEGSGLTDESVDLLKSMLYPCGDNLLLFADLEVALRAIPDADERRRFAKAVSRKKAVLVRIKIDADADIVSLASYWGPDGRQKDLVPLLNSMRLNSLRGIEDSHLNIAMILPKFARERLFNYPFAASTAGGVKEDCFWTAMNFFNDEPDNQLNNFDYAAQVLQKDYYSIREPSQLGDLILVMRPDGRAIHAAAYIADDVVFTKNGEAYTQPWMLMRMADMIDTYKIQNPEATLLYFRKKSR